MLNVYISADIEGVNNVVYSHQIERGEGYILTQKQQAAELNYIIEALIESGVDKITVNDAHGSMDNLHIQELNPKIELITGKPKAVSMLANLDKSYSCVFFTGYHAKAGSDGILSHTFSTIFRKVKLNNKIIGEIELNAVYAGLVNVSVALVTGDDKTCDEAETVLKNVVTVSTKTAISNTSAKCKPNEQLFKELKSTVKKTMANPQNWILYKEKPPYTLELDFHDKKLVDIVELLPGIERKSPSGIKFTSNDYTEIYKLMQFLSATLSRL